MPRIRSVVFVLALSAVLGLGGRALAIAEISPIGKTLNSTITQAQVMKTAVENVVFTKGIDLLKSKTSLVKTLVKFLAVAQNPDLAGPTSPP
jgi:hypothetical protein